MKEISFNNGDVIFRQGEPATVMYNILAGKVGIFTGYGTEQQESIAEMEKDQTFGEMGMIEYYPRSATAVALEDGTTLAEIGEDELNEYFRDKPEKILRLMKQLSQRIRETTQKYLDVCHTLSEHEKADDLERRLEIEEQMALFASYYNDMWI